MKIYVYTTYIYNIYNIYIYIYIYALCYMYITYACPDLLRFECLKPYSLLLPYVCFQEWGWLRVFQNTLGKKRTIQSQVNFFISHVKKNSNFILNPKYIWLLSFFLFFLICYFAVPTPAVGLLLRGKIRSSNLNHCVLPLLL